MRMMDHENPILQSSGASLALEMFSLANNNEERKKRQRTQNNILFKVSRKL